VTERDLVVLALRRELPDLEHEGQTYTTTWFDMFRVADGKIVEHWDYGTKE
jgi:predicted SnoaL-like aldol condensation-catalyzing enzyme